MNVNVESLVYKIQVSAISLLKRKEKKEDFNGRRSQTASLILNILIRSLRKYHNTHCLSPKFCISVVSVQFLLVPRESKNDAYAKFEGQTKSIAVFSQVTY